MTLTDDAHEIQPSPTGARPRLVLCRPAGEQLLEFRLVTDKDLAPAMIDRAASLHAGRDPLDPPMVRAPEHGTLFLDEVSDLLPAAQAKLLRALQDLTVERVGGYGLRRVNTRIVVATNRTLTSLVEKGRFRADLYYRLKASRSTCRRCARVATTWRSWRNTSSTATGTCA